MPTPGDTDIGITIQTFETAIITALQEEIWALLKQMERKSFSNDKWRIQKEANENSELKKYNNQKTKILPSLKGIIKFIEENISALITD